MAVNQTPELYERLVKDYQLLTERTARLADDLRSLQSAYTLLVEAYRGLLPAPTGRRTAAPTASNGREAGARS